MSVRLLHTADWHIGKSFAHIQGDTAALLRQARFEAVVAITKLASERSVDAILVAGDVFDDEQVASDTIRKLFVCLEGYPGPCVLLPGNHDPARPSGLWDRLAGFDRPANVILATRPEPVELRDGELIILPSPLTSKSAGRDPSGWMDECETPASAYRVGLAHGSVIGFLPESAELSHAIDPQRSVRAGLDYLALGDWHGALEINPRTWYCGTPEADSFASRDTGHALLVEIAEPGAQPSVVRIPTSKFDWRRETLRFAGETATDVEGAIDSRLIGAESTERTLIRLDLEGSLNLGVRMALDQAIAKWRARFRYLDLRDERLLVNADQASLAQLNDGGILADVASSLDRQTQEGSDEDRQIAALALRLLYMEHARAGSDR